MASIARSSSSILRQTAALSAASSSSTNVARQQLFRATAAFHTSSRRNLLTPLPQVVRGGINDPAPIPPPHPSHGSYHWTFDRLIAASTIPLTIVPFASGSLNPLMDGVLCAVLLIHSHFGFQNVITDYIPTWRMPKIRKALEWALRAATLLVGVGLYEFETNDVGITEAVKRIWTA